MLSTHSVIINSIAQPLDSLTVPKLCFTWVHPGLNQLIHACERLTVKSKQTYLHPIRSRNGALRHLYWPWFQSYVIKQHRATSFSTGLSINKTNKITQLRISFCQHSVQMTTSAILPSALGKNRTSFARQIFSRRVLFIKWNKTASFQKEAMRTQVALWFFFMKWKLYRDLPLCLTKQNVWTHELRKVYCFKRLWSERNDLIWLHLFMIKDETHSSWHIVRPTSR